MIVSFRGELEVDSKGTRDDHHYTRWHAASPGSRYTTLKDATRNVAAAVALEQAVQGAKDNLASLTHHSDHGSQYPSIMYKKKLVDHGIKPSTGTVGDSNDTR